MLDEALKSGFHGAMIGSQPKGQGGVLDDPDLAEQAAMLGGTATRLFGIA